MARRGRWRRHLEEALTASLGFSRRPSPASHRLIVFYSVLGSFHASSCTDQNFGPNRGKLVNNHIIFFDWCRLETERLVKRHGSRTREGRQDEPSAETQVVTMVCGPTHEVFSDTAVFRTIDQPAPIPWGGREPVQQNGTRTVAQDRLSIESVDRGPLDSTVRCLNRHTFEIELVVMLPDLRSPIPVVVTLFLSLGLRHTETHPPSSTDLRFGESGSQLYEAGLHGFAALTTGERHGCRRLGNQNLGERPFGHASGVVLNFNRIRKPFSPPMGAVSRAEADAKLDRVGELLEALAALGQARAVGGDRFAA